jgi:DNA-binding NarL/FixJ family response regulator
MLLPSEVVVDPYAEFLRGNVASALALAERLDASGVADVSLLALMLECRLARGELNAALSLGARLRPELDGIEGEVAAMALAQLALAVGSADEAVELFDKAGVVAHHPDRALALARTGRQVQAETAATALVQRARETGDVYDLAAALRVLAFVTSGGNRLELLAEAADLLAAIPAQRLAAQIATDRAGLLILTGQPEDRALAIDLLRQAEQYAAREDLYPLRSRVRPLLQRLGQEPVSTRSELMAALTPREGLIARLAAEGRTNRDIATELSNSSKPFEWHRSPVYRKLGVRGGGALAASLG